MYIILELFDYCFFLVKSICLLLLFFIIKGIFYILKYFRIIDRNSEFDITIKDIFKTKEERESEIRGRIDQEINPKKMKSYFNRFYFKKCYYLQRHETDNINKIFNEYQSEEKLSKRMYYNILYASKFFGFMYCYIFFSRRKYYFLDEEKSFSENVFVKHISKKYMLSSKMFLEYLIKNHTNAEDIYKFFYAVIKYSLYTPVSYEKKVIEIFKTTMNEVIYSGYSNDKFNADTRFILAEKIVSLYKESHYLYEEISNIYIDLIFNALFNHIPDEYEISKLEYFNQCLKLCFNKNNPKKNINYLIKKLYNLTAQYLINENEKDNYWYEKDKPKIINAIKSIMLILKDLGEPIDKTIALIPQHESFTDLINQLLNYILEEKLEKKNMKEKVKKI